MRAMTETSETERIQGASERRRTRARRWRPPAPPALAALATILAALAAVIAGPVTVRAQGVPPDADWRTLRTEHFRITFTPELERLARHAADRAEVAYERLAAQLTEPPEGVIDVVVTDHIDRSSGFAGPLPSNRITLHAKPPAGDVALGFYDDWIDLVLIHELVHIFHMDRTGQVGRVLRAVFGRVPWTWPVFPVIGTPTWSTEGLATYFESRLTGAGRVHGSYHEMIVRTAVLEDAFPGIDGAEGIGASWPSGQSAYVFGSLFIDHLVREHGADTPRRLVDETVGAWLPPIFRFDGVAEDAIERSFTDAWTAWHTELVRRYARLADSLRARRLTRSERLTGEGRWLALPRVSPDGSRVVFGTDAGRDDPATRVFDARTGTVRTIGERGQSGGDLGPASWLPGGRDLVLAQLRFADTYRAYEDLFRVGADGGERRLTHGARVAEPDVASDGRRVVAVQTMEGTNRLVVYDLETGELRALTEASPERSWALPRWSPDGDRIAAARWSAGGDHDVVVLDTAGAVVMELGRDRAIDSAPAWSPDGRYLLFWSDRSGIPNLYAHDMNPRAAARDGVAAGRLRQVTNVLGGAFDPDVSPDGRWIYFVGYHADGFHLERMPYDPEAWGQPSAASTDGGAYGRVRADAVADASGGTAGRMPGGGDRSDAVPEPERRDGSAGSPQSARAASAAVEPFSAWPTLRPRFWMPTLSTGDIGTFIGAYTFGEDIVGRHSYDAAAAYAPEPRLFEARVDYRYAGFGNPVLGLSVSQSWDYVSFGRVDGRLVGIRDRERSLELAGTLIRRRLRSAAALTVGGEWVDERRVIQGAPGMELVDPGGRLLGAFARVGFGNYRVHPYSISRENGISLAAEASRRWDTSAFTHAELGLFDESYDQLVGRLATYLDFPLVGFADHVLATRVAGIRSSGPGAPLDGVGGAAGSARNVFGESIGGPRHFLPVRGYGEDHRRGTRAWTASAEYRFPLALVEEGVRLWPVFLDRVSGALFVDAGDAWCDPATAAAVPDIPGVCVDRMPVVGAGAELAVDLSLGFAAPVRVRSGVGWPISLTDDRRPVFYVRLGPSF